MGQRPLEAPPKGPLPRHTLPRATRTDAGILEDIRDGVQGERTPSGLTFPLALTSRYQFSGRRGDTCHANQKPGLPSGLKARHNSQALLPTHSWPLLLPTGGHITVLLCPSRGVGAGCQCPSLTGNLAELLDFSVLLLKPPTVTYPASISVFLQPTRFQTLCPVPLVPLEPLSQPTPSHL